jgi:hypothetical protein
MDVVWNRLQLTDRVGLSSNNTETAATMPIIEPDVVARTLEQQQDYHRLEPLSRLYGTG